MGRRRNLVRRRTHPQRRPVRDEGFEAAQSTEFEIVSMPELSRFYGIIIRMFYGDHAPPHFHAVYQGEEVQVNIESLEVMNGAMRRRALVLVLEWAALHRDELRLAWEQASHNQEPSKIEPLD